MDKETLKRLEPVLIESERQLTASLNRFSEDQYSYRQRSQTLRLITESLNKLDQMALEEYIRQSRGLNDLALDLAEEEVTALNKTEGIITPSLRRDTLSIERNDYLINNFEASLKTYSAETRYNITNAISQGMLQKRTGYEITTKLSRYMALKTWKVQRIVRTEQHRLFNSSKLLAYGQFQKDDFQDMKKTLYHPMDDRTADDSKQLAKIGPIVNIDQPFVFVYRYKRANGSVRRDKRVFMAPPDRPNDRASLLPYRKQWELEK